MAFNYLIKKNALDAGQYGFYWLACVVPFSIKDGFNHSFDNPGSFKNSNGGDLNPIKEDDLILIDGDIINWSTNSSKSNNVSSLSLTLTRSNLNYLTHLTPGDWILFWAFNNKSDYLQVKNNVKSRTRSNHFKNAIKFVGRIDSIVKDRTTNMGTGQPTVFYSVSAHGFDEFNASMYYNPSLGAIAEENIKPLVILSDFSKESIQTLTSKEDDITGAIAKGILSSQRIIPVFLRTCLGVGPGINFRNPVSTESADTLIFKQTQASPNQVFQIPNTVAQLLLPPDAPKSKQDNYNYADLINVLISVQQYSSSNNSGKIVNNQFYKGFQPDKDSHDILGSMAITTLNFNNVSVWSILKSYSNDSMNEMYITLRVNTDGYVMPTFICRQLPFTSPDLQPLGMPVTEYLSLPRWNIDDSMIFKIQTGKSNSLRLNYTQMQPWSIFGDNIAGQALNHILSVPVIDNLDIKRSGLRMDVGQIKSAYIAEITTEDSNEIGTIWNIFKADILFGGHLKLSGTIVCNFIQEPICIGDNCVADDVIYHIEEVNHSGGIDESGNKVASTSLNVTHGLSIDSDGNVQKLNSGERLVYVDSSYTDRHETENFGIDFEDLN